MTIQKITAARLAGWQKKLALSNATPLVLVGIGQEHKSGEIVVCVPDNGPRDTEIAQLLQGVAQKLAGG